MSERRITGAYLYRGRHAEAKGRILRVLLRLVTNKWEGERKELHVYLEGLLRKE